MPYELVEPGPRYEVVDDGGVGKDIAKSVATAPLRAASGIVGLPSTLIELASMGLGKLMPNYAEALKPELPNFGRLAEKGYEELGIGHKPQTRQGKYASAATEGAILGGLPGLASGIGSQAGGDLTANQSPTVQFLASMAGGLAGGAAANKIAQPIQSSLNAEQQAIVDRAKEMGLKLTPGQQTGNRRMLGFENTTEALPGGGYLPKVRGENFEKANEIALKSIGVQGKELNPTVVAKAADDIGSEISRLTQGRTIRLDKDFFDAVDKLKRNYRMLSPDQQSAEVNAMLKNWSKPSGVSNMAIPSEVYQANRSAYDTAARAAYRSGTNQTEARIQAKLADALDEAAQRSMPKSDLDAFREARRKWSNLVVLEGSDLAKSGYNINPNKLAQELAKQNKKVGRVPLGERDLVDLSRMPNLLREVTPNSGTPERLFWTSILSGGGLGGYLGASGGPVGVAVGAGAGAGVGALAPFVLPYLAQHGIMLPGANQWLSGSLSNLTHQQSPLTGAALGGILSQ